MLAFLMACLPNNLSGGGGGGPFAISGVNLTQNQAGTSCANLFRLNVSLVYTGSASGATVLLERSWNGGAYTTVASGLDPATDFPYVVEQDGYYNKFGVLIPTLVRITDEADATNTATSAAYNTTYTECA